MIEDGRDIPTGTVKSTQVCVIGSGIAGVTAAWELQKAGFRVILLEGSRQYDTYEASWKDKYLLYKGVAEGLFTDNERDFLVLPYVNHDHPAWERERTYGGTGSHWGGQSRPHDPVDFEPRENFPGWPINLTQLNDYYARASTLSMLHGDWKPNGYNFSKAYWESQLEVKAPALEGFDVEMYQFIGPNFRNFATRQFDDGSKDGKTIGETSVDVIRNASLLEINQQTGRVTSLKVASMDTSDTPRKATTFTVKADAFVLACGAVENARLMLLSEIGNEHGQVGLYFMCHPLIQNQFIFTNAYLPQAQSNYMGGKDKNGNPWSDTNNVRCNARFIPNREETKKRGIGRCWFWYHFGQYYFEMSPTKNSYVTLTDKDDKDHYDTVFDQRQTRIHWELNDKVDKQTYEQTTSMYVEAIKVYGGKLLDPLPSFENLTNLWTVNGHHLGTTRMSTDPADGVVDINSKVHSLQNFFVAGSSVFPTACISNPTFTIIALAIRLADFIRDQFHDGRLG